MKGTLITQTPNPDNKVTNQASVNEPEIKALSANPKVTNQPLVNEPEIKALSANPKVTNRPF